MRVRACLGSLLATILIASVASAQETPLTPPSSLTVASLECYNTILETDDTFCLAVFEIFYAAATDRPSELASSTMIVRLTSGSGIHALLPVASLVFRGYHRGVAGFYFEADDALLPTWDDATLVAQVTGNPALSWTGGQPVSNLLAASYNTAADSAIQKAAIISLLRTELPKIESNVFEHTATVFDLLSGTPASLTASGEEYMALAAPDLRNLVPAIYTFSLSNPDIISYGRTTLTASVLAAALTIVVNERERTGIVVDQRLLLFDDTNAEYVTVTSVSGNSVGVCSSDCDGTPVGLVNGFASGTPVWITSQVLEKDIDDLIDGTFIDTMLQGGADAFGISRGLFGLFLGMGTTLFFTAVGTIAMRSWGINTMAGPGILFLLLTLSFTSVGVIPVMALMLLVTVFILLGTFRWAWDR